jgi:succinoglycan biosynthesis transport protein ExoP
MWFRRKSAKVAAATVDRAVPARGPQAQPAKPTAKPAVDADGELDVRSLGRALWRRKRTIIIPALIVAVLTAVAVQVITPKYKSSATILYEGRENIFMRPDVERTTNDRGLADAEALTSQVQLVLSRDVARDVIKKLKLNELPEFDPLVKGIPPWKRALIMLGVSRNPLRMTPEERVLEAYYERLTAYPLDRSRVITIEFESSDPELAASVTNAIADAYLEAQQRAKQDQTTGVAAWLNGEIAKLRPRVAEAEAKVEAFRGKTNLFIGTNNMTLSSQQLGEFSSQLAQARAQKADAETRARLIRDMLRRGDPIEASDVINSDLIRRLSEQRVTLRAQLAEQSSTLLDGHPRIKELKAQIADLDKQITGEAEKIVRSLENDAKIAGARVDALSANLDQLKRQAATTNEQDVQLRALQLEAAALRDTLESYLKRYREATARETIADAPPDTRIISRAVVSNTPYFPKKLPTILVAMLATLVISAGFVTTGELMRHSPVGGSRPLPAPAQMPAPAQVPVAAWGLERTRPSPAPAHPQPDVAFSAIDEIARSLREAGEGGRRLAVFGASRNVGTTLCTVTLARALGREARVVLVDLAVGAPNIAAISSDPHAPGIADVVRGSASFGDVITRDKVSRVHLIAAGQIGADGAAIIASPRLAMMVEALARTYDHVIIDAGTTFETAADRLHRLAPRAVLVATEQMAAATEAARDRLIMAGYGEIAVLDGAATAAAAEVAA